MTKPEIDDRLTFFTHLMNFTCFMNFFLASCSLLPALFTCFIYLTSFFVTLTVAEVLIIAKKHVTEQSSETTQESVSNSHN